MGLKVKAVERLLKFDKEKGGKYRYVMKPEMYSSLKYPPAYLHSGERHPIM